MKISKLIFFPKDRALDIIDVGANSLALQIDKVLRIIHGAS